MEVKWIDSQREAINHYKKDKEHGAVISAGAGSGKTTVLTEMVINRIKDGTLDISRCAVVTFTEKAAGELKVRLGAGLKSCIEENKDDIETVKRLKLGRRNLGQARISTISSFCFGIIRDNIELSELSDGFSVIDDQCAQFMKLSAVNEALDEFCNTRGDDMSFLLEQTESRGFEAIVDYVIRLREFLCSLCNRSQWIADTRSMAYDKSVLSERLKEVKDICEAAVIAFNTFEEMANDAGEKIAEYSQQHKKTSLEAINKIINNNYRYCDEVKELIDDAPAKSTAPIRKNGELTAARDAYISAYTVAVKKAAEYTPDSDEGKMSRAERIINVLLDLTLCYEKKYNELKLSRNNADFTDAEYMVYNMLKSHPEIKEKMDLQLIVVDEFQDSNKMQYEIFRMLSDNCRNLYFVGDIKQSIYGFRKAQPEVFAEVCADTEHYKERKLSENFRSRGNVINGINYIFDRIMTKELGGVDYPNEGRLIAGRKDKYSEEDKTEVLLVNNRGNESTTSEVQARAIAEKIRSMTGHYMIKDKDGSRPCTPEDFAIIIRSPSHVAENYIKALKEQGLSAEVRDGKLTEQPEIRIMLDFLAVIDNPYNNDSLARLMMSVLYGFTAQQMTEIKLGLCDIDTKALKAKIGEEKLRKYSREFKKKSLYGCIKAAADGYTDENVSSAEGEMGVTRKKCIGLTADLQSLSKLKESLSPAELIRHIYDSTPAKNLLIISEDPQSRAENLSVLADCARDYSDINGGGTLGDFLRNLQILDEQNRAPRAASSAGGGVKLLSIHSSKGLQFPIVFVAECNGKFNTSDASKGIIFSEKYGIACNTVERSKFSNKPSLSMNKVKDEIIARLKSEEMRLLYVAATRAQEKLFFVIAQKTSPAPNGEAETSILNNFITSAKPDDINGSGYYMWLRAVLRLDAPEIGTATDDSTSAPIEAGLESADGEEACEDAAEESVIADDIDEFSIGDLVYRELAASDKGDIGEDEEYTAEADNQSVEKIVEMISFPDKYRYLADTKIAGKYSATEIVRNKKLSEGSKDVLFISRPQFMHGKDELKGKSRGDAYHKLMEHLPLYKTMTEKDIADYLENDAPKFLTESEIKCIDIADIAEFMNNEIVKRIAAVGKENLYREHPIFHKIKASELSAEELGIEDGVELSDSETYIQGIVDMFFIEGDHIVLVDYKTDRFKNESEPIEHYKVQLEIYRKALQAQFNLPVTQMYIYSFKFGKFIPVPIN